MSYSQPRYIFIWVLVCFACTISMNRLKTSCIEKVSFCITRGQITVKQMELIYMLNDILHAAILTAISFILLICLSRLLGRKALSQMTYFDFTMIISFGSVTANVGIVQNPTFESSDTTLICFGLLGTLSGYLHIKSFRFKYS